MADSSTNKGERGRRTAPSNSFFASGLFQGFRNIGTRIKAAHYKPVIEAFCACAGRIAAEDGRLKPAEIAGFRRFILENHAHPVICNFVPDELQEKFKAYAIHVFLEEEEAFIRVLDPIVPGSEAAQMIVTGCLAVAFSDGVCDPGERLQLENLAVRLGVEIGELTQALGVDLPPASHSSNPDKAPQQQAASDPQPVIPNSEQQVCTLCQGKGCVFCNGTGFKS